MSYYVLPKINNNIIINPTINLDENDIYTSFSLFTFYNKNKEQIKNLIKTEESINIFKDLLTIINPYEYIFSKVPGFKHSISKLNTKTNIFYELLEIINSLNIFVSFSNKKLTCLHISENYLDSNHCINFCRNSQNNEHTNFEDINEEIYNTINDKRYEFIFYEIKIINFENLNSYILNISQVLMIILKYQLNNGVCLIKINHTFYKPIIDIIYILSSIYEKVYIIKPNTNDITTFDKYIVCKNFIIDDVKKDIYKKYYFELAKFINAYLQNNNNNNNNINSNSNILSILNHEIPTYFINKINDVNIIIGQQQLEATDQIINIFKNKSKNDKIESIKNNNIQKAIMWCEKNKIPYNNISEKVNIFLPLKKEIV